MTKAAICREFGAPLAIEEVALAPPGPGEVTVRMTACAICHSDLTYLSGGWGGALPAVFGHEAAGVVAETGAGVAELRPGDTVGVTLIRSCGACRSCRQGLEVVCESRFPLDERSPLRGAGGEAIRQGLRTAAFAEAVTVHASQVAAVPPDLPPSSACLLACGVLTGVGAVANTARVPAGADVVVIGTGGVGLNVVQGAVLADAATIVAVDLSDDKLAAARRFGATHAVNAARDDVAAAVRDLTGGRGADYVFVAVGAKAAIEQAPALLARGGAAVIVGMPASDVLTTFDPGNLATLGQRILGSKMGSARIRTDIPRLVELYREGRLKLDELVTGRYPLDAINDAVASARRGEALRNVVVF